MKRIPAAMLLVTVVLVFGCDPAWTQRVRVVNAGDKTPIAGAKAELTCDAEARKRSAAGDYTAMSDKTGYATLGGVGYGVDSSCTIEVSKDGYRSSSFKVADHCTSPEPKSNEEYLQCRTGELEAVLSAAPAGDEDTGPQDETGTP